MLRNQDDATLLLPMGTWCALLLNEAGEELAREGRLQGRIRRDLGEEVQPLVADLDGPAAGYVFLPAGERPERFMQMERRPYVAAMLTVGEGARRRLALVQKHELMRMLAAPEPEILERGAAVRVTEGRYVRAFGRVLQPRYPDVHHLVIQVRARTLRRELVVHQREVEPLEERGVPPICRPCPARHRPRGEQLDLVR